MDWIDEGILLSARKHGESSVIAVALSRAHGRHAGLVRGGTGRKVRGVLQAGNRLQLHWRARLADHLGSYTVELLDGYAGAVLDDGDRLAALASACAMTEAALAEREAHPALYDGLKALMAALPGDDWAMAYVAWEVGLLGELGFGLDLEHCAATGGTDDLIYVSPKTGRAVSRDAGAPYADKLLALPGFLIGQAAQGPSAVADGLQLTGHFLKRHVFTESALPPARGRLLNRLALTVD